MRNCIIILFVALFAASCGQEKKEKKEKTVEISSSIDTIVKEEVKRDSLIIVDTLQLCDNVFLYRNIDTIESKDYYEDSKIRYSLTEEINNSFLSFKAIEEYLLEKDSNLVARLDDTLVLKLNNETEISYIDSANYQYYIYNNNFRNLNFYLLVVHFYEGSCYALVDKSSGRLTYIWDKPYFNKTGSMFFTCSVDLLAGYVPNGIQFFRLGTDTILNEFSCDIDNWGPNGIRWINDTIVQIERTFIKFGNDSIWYENDYIEVSFNLISQEKFDERLFRNLNELEEFADYESTGGATIGDEFEYGIGSYRSTKLKTTQLIVFEKLHRENAKAKYSIIDTLLIKDIPDNHYIGYQLCRLNEKMDSEIIVLFEHEEDVEYYKKIKKAWRADRKLKRIFEIDITGIDYCNEGYGV